MSSMMRYLPIFAGVLLIVGLTIPQIKMTDRFAGTNVSAEQRAHLLEKVPIDVGDWHGQNMDIDPEVRAKAGAIGAVSRMYRNSRTGEQVDLWLIVGHSRDVSFHTPDVCYPGSGFTARASENSLYPMVFDEKQKEGTPFLTNTFFRESDVSGHQLVRVFWAWYNPENAENHGNVVWEAPSNARWHFGNARSLYKMYFTSLMHDPTETAEQSACVRFARDFLPIVNKALEEVQGGTDESTTSAATATAAKPVASESKESSPNATVESKPAEKPTENGKAPSNGVYEAAPPITNGIGSGK
jgi:Protein of unknown function (DUF3485)